jgi:hypothetical protein
MKSLQLRLKNGLLRASCTQHSIFRIRSQSKVTSAMKSQFKLNVGQTVLLFAFLCASFVPMPASGASRLNSAEPQTLPELVAQLESWLDIHAAQPMRSERPTIRFIDVDLAVQLAGKHSLALEVAPRGLYDAETQTISLVLPWSVENPHDVSVLLHELVHHRQATAGHWYCPGAMELPAYRLQQAWLNELNLEASINWVAVVLESGCAPRDIHPN